MNKLPDNSSAQFGPVLDTRDPIVEHTKDSRGATILQVLPALGSGGGVERGTIEMVRAIAESGGRALVASAGGGQVHEVNRAGGTHFDLPMSSKNPVIIYNNIRRLVELIKEENVDLVHVRSRAPAWSTFYAVRQTGLPLITTFHGTYNTENFLKRAYNSIMTRGDRVIAISDFIGEHVHRYYGVPVSRLRIIHRGVDLFRFNRAKVSAERIVQLADAWRITEGHPVIMLPGRLTRWKGQVEFIEAIARLNRRDIRCLIVGSDQGRSVYRQDLESLVKKYDLGEVVRIVDHCSDMPAAYMLSDVVVSASTDPEAFGRVLIEAQALGRPVIASDHGGARETVLKDQTGWLVPPGDVDALSLALGKVLELDEESRTSLSDVAITNVVENFSKEKMCNQTLAVYDEVLHIPQLID